MEFDRFGSHVVHVQVEGGTTVQNVGVSGAQHHHRPWVLSHRRLGEFQANVLPLHVQIGDKRVNGAIFGQCLESCGAAQYGNNAIAGLLQDQAPSGENAFLIVGN